MFNVLNCLKGNIVDVVNKKHVKSITGWGGNCTKDGRYGLSAPPSGGMDILDLRSGEMFGEGLKKTLNFPDLLGGCTYPTLP